MTRPIYIVRHGNTFDKGETVTRVGARTDLTLSQSGKEQADRLARHFRDAGIAFTKAMAGPLRRTVETAQAILSLQSTPPPLEIEPFLREIDYGPDENHPEEDVLARIGEEALHRWETEAVVPDGWQVDPDALIEAWRSWFSTLAASSASGPVLCVTSNGIARFALLASGASPGPANNLKLKTGAWARFDLADDASAAIGEWNVRP